MMLQILNINLFARLMVISIDILLLFALPSVLLLIVLIFLWRFAKNQKEKLFEIKSKNIELKELLKNLVASNKELSAELTTEKQKNKNLISKTSREINTSVNGILGMANLLKDFDLNNEQIKNANAIIKSGEKLLQNTKLIFEGDSNPNKILITMNDQFANKKPKHPVSPEFSNEFPVKILVAEDDLINQHLAVKMLNKLGYKPDIVSNGKEALEIVSEKQYDVILMDGLMPEMDGFEATKMIRLCLETQPVIIALTASTMYGDKEKCIQAGMDDYLSKPIDLNLLAAMIERWAMKKKVVA
jgi:CheY-like chemotaxis protein